MSNFVLTLGKASRRTNSDFWVTNSATPMGQLPAIKVSQAGGKVPGLIFKLVCSSTFKQTVKLNYLYHGKVTPPIVPVTTV